MPPLARAVLVILVSLSLALALALAAAPGAATIAGYPVLIALAFLAFAVQWLVFIPSYLYQTEHYYDLTGSLTYLVLVVTALLAGPEEPSARGFLLAVLVGVWALRLGSFLFQRIKAAGKDGRFDEIKTRWPRFLVTWTLQGLWVFVTLLAALVAIATDQPRELGLVAAVGLVLWGLGFWIEVAADSQKSRFNADPANKGRFVNVGVWRWSRHPNYFGEILLWTGIAVIAAPVFQGGQWLALISPVFVAFLLLKVSGVPLLEKRADKKWGEDPEYQAYKQRTPVLIPRRPS